MRPKTLTVTTVTGAANADLYFPNWRESDFGIGFGVAVTGTKNYTVQHAFDDPEDFSSASDYNTNATWYDHESVAAATASADGNYAFPVRGIRLVGNSGTGTVVGTFLQAT